MVRRKVNINKIRPNYFMVFLTIVIFFVFVVRIFYFCAIDYKVGNDTITTFIKNRNTEEEVIMPTRGSIMDKNGNNVQITRNEFKNNPDMYIHHSKGRIVLNNGIIHKYS